jgi:hypothetical protein
MPPIQSRENKVVADLVGLLWEVGLATRLTPLLYCQPLHAISFLDQYSNKFTGCERCFVFKEVIVNVFYVLRSDLKVCPIVGG